MPPRESIRTHPSFNSLHQAKYCFDVIQHHPRSLRAPTLRGRESKANETTQPAGGLQGSRKLTILTLHLCRKKKWSKGKTKDKANNAVVFDKPTFDRAMKEVSPAFHTRLPAGSSLTDPRFFFCYQVPTYKMISQCVFGVGISSRPRSQAYKFCPHRSVLIDRLKINGSLARLVIKHLAEEGQIKPIIHSRAQLVYSMCRDSLARHPWYTAADLIPSSFPHSARATGTD